MRHDGIFRIPTHLPGVASNHVATMGAKAYDLSRMVHLGLPVPPAFVLGTTHCRSWYREPGPYRKGLPTLLAEQMCWLQSITGLEFGDSCKPLLVSVRSGAPVSMPGMMNTLLNIGLCDSTVQGLLQITSKPRLVWDSYRRLIQSFAELVFGVSPQPFASALEALLTREHLNRPQELDIPSLFELTQTYLQLFAGLTGHQFPQNPHDQLETAVQAVFSSWNSSRAVEYRRLNGIREDLFTAAIIQQMVFGNAGGASGSGVGFTRDPDTGENKLYFDFLFDSQGDDLVSGRTSDSDADRLFSAMPATGQELAAICAALEREFRDAQEFEFTVQDGKLYLLQTRSAKRTQWAALRIAVEQAREGLIDQQEALDRLEGLPLDDIKRLRLSLEGEPLCKGESVGIGVAIGSLVLDIDSIRNVSSKGGLPVVLVRENIFTFDSAAIALSAGVLTAQGNRTSHAATVSRQLGKPCITNCGGMRIDLDRRVVEFGDQLLPEGTPITLDSNTGLVYAGKAEVVVDHPKEWQEEIRRWLGPL